MTFLTLSRCKGRMDVLLEEFRVLGRMRVMATNAIDHGWIDMKVCRREGIVLEVVTPSAQILKRCRKKSRLCRKMRFVAIQAVVLRWRMHILLAHPLLQILMAGQTEVGAFCQEKLGYFRLVRVVALGALIVDNRRVRTLCAFHLSLEIGMAGKA